MSYLCICYIDMLSLIQAEMGLKRKDAEYQVQDIGKIDSTYSKFDWFSRSVYAARHRYHSQICVR